MKESIYKYFQVGTLQWMSYPADKRDFAESIREMACDDFFNAIELSHTPKEDLEQVRHMLQQSHMKICFATQPMLLKDKLNPNDLNETARQQAENLILQAIDEAEYLGAAGISFMSGKWEPQTKDQAYAQLLKTTKAVCNYAASKNMLVELEVFDYDMDKACLIGPAPLAAHFAADVCMECHNFGLLVDLSHFPTTYETSQFVIRTLRPYITHFHIGNAVVKKGCTAYGDLHPRFGFPDSANDVAELLDFFRVLKQEGFFNAEKPYVLSTEVKPWADEDCAIILANSKRVIKRAWALLED